MLSPQDPLQNSEYDPRGAVIGFGFATLLMGAALGAATTLLLSAKTGPDLRVRVAEATGDWKAQAAQALAQGREKLIAAVESHSQKIS